MESDGERRIFHFSLLKEIKNFNQRNLPIFTLPTKTNKLTFWPVLWSAVVVKPCNYNIYYATFPKLWLCFGLRSTAPDLAADYNTRLLWGFFCACMCVFVFPQARDFLSFTGYCCALVKRSAWKCCDLAPTACPNNESGHRYLGSQRQVGGMLLHSRWHRNWCRALKPKEKSVVLNLPKGSSLTLLIYNNKVWEKADISSCKTCLCKESWEKKKKEVKFQSNCLHLYLQWVWSAVKPSSAP